MSSLTAARPHPIVSPMFSRRAYFFSFYYYGFPRNGPWLETHARMS